MTNATLRQAIARVPRIYLAHLPTPLEFCSRLTETLKGPKIFVKRDDCTGLAFGGNKTRILEFTVAQAVEHRADVLIGGASSQSNHCRQLAATAAKLGLDCALVLAKDRKSSTRQGNLLLDDLLGAHVELVTVDSIEDLDSAKADLKKRLEKQGRRPFVVMQPALRHFGAMGYALCMAELADQFQQLGERIDTLIVCSSSATQPGLVFANKILDLGVRIVGIAPIKWSYDIREAFLNVLRGMAAVLDLSIRFTHDDIENLDTYVGSRGYGFPTPAGNAAMRLLARTEGIIADPIYSAKALAALVDLVEKRDIVAGENVTFLHTGGTPALFSYHKELA